MFGDAGSIPATSTKFCCSITQAKFDPEEAVVKLRLTRDYL